jgi:dTDP-4-amino-4,6-dideoxygalactose transaminase
LYIVGEEEIAAIAKVIRSGALFRYGVGGECERFERRYADYLGVKQFALAASGSNALAAAMIAVGLGPGDEVIIPAHTYMATATSVLAVGAIPVIVDIDESLTISPEAFENAIGPCTKAVVPVHMWGAACDMGAIMGIARRRGLLVIEDACQGVGGGYEGRRFGAIGDVGCFSFNYYKNMTSGEGGGVAVNNDVWAERARCAIDPCHFYWQGRHDTEKPFSANGARASELMGAMLNVQLDRLDGMVAAMRRERRQVLQGVAPLANLGVKPAPMNSPDHDCSTQTMLTLPSAESAERFVSIFPSVIAGKTGRHNYTEWDQILMGFGAAHPAMNPFEFSANTRCRKTYSKDMCARSLEILNRTVMVPTHPLHSEKDIEDAIHNIGVAARVVFGGLKPEDADLRNVKPVDAQKFDMKVDA